MAQHDYVISNGTGAAVRSDLNNALSAIVTQNSGSTEPTTTYAYQMWADTNAGVMKIRNGANSAWITLYQLDGEWTSIAFENGSAAAPSIYFKDSGTDTGFFSGGTDQVNIATAGTERVEWGTSEVVFNDAGNNYDFRVEGDTNANLLFVDASADAVGIGTSTPGTALDVNGAIRSNDIFTLYKNSTDAFYIGAGTIITGGTSTDIALRSNQNGSILFSTNGATERMRIDASGRVGIGTTSPSTLLHLSSTSPRLRVQNSGASGTAQIELIEGGQTNPYYILTGDSRCLIFQDHSSERARIDSSGRLLVGTSTSNAPGSLNSKIQVEALDFTGSYSAVRNSADTGGPQLVLGKSRGTALNAKTVVVSGDTLGSANFFGADGTNFIEGASIAAVVDGTPGANDMPGRLVFSTTADGASSPTERARINQLGFSKFSNNGSYRNANDNYFEFLSDKSGNVVLHVTATNGSYAEGILYLNAHRAATSSYAFLDCRSGNDADREFYLRGDGNAFADGTWSGGGADYAEYFEWFDANPNEEDRRGISVVLDGDKIREAVAGEDPIGVISGNPSVVGDAAWNKWSGKYIRDEFGSYLLDENGERQLNSAYDPDQEYIPREQRPEWDCVGLMGKLRIRKGQVTGSRWIKMRDISDSVEEWLVR